MTFSFRSAILLKLLLISASVAYAQDNSSANNSIKQGARYALVVGVSKYKSSAFTPLKFATNDARAFVQFLKSDAGGNVPDSCIYMFLNAGATLPRIYDLGIEKINRKIANGRINKNDMIFVYLSGHGGAYKSLTESYFFLYNSNKDQDAANSLRITYLKWLVGQWASHCRVILIFDACRSVEVADGVAGKEGIELVSSTLSKNNGEILFAASSGGQEAMETKLLGHSIFTYHLLKGLYGFAPEIKPDKVIDGKELNAYIDYSLSAFLEKNHLPNQDPVIIWGQNGELKNIGISKLIEDKKTEYLMSLMDSASTSDQYVGKSSVPMNRSDFSLSFSDYKALFLRAMQTGHIITPRAKSAFEYFKKMQETNVDKLNLENYQDDLSLALQDIAHQVLQKDLLGIRDYASNSIDDSSNVARGKAYDYYNKAVVAMNAYRELSDRFELSPQYECLFAYLQARASSMSLKKDRELVRAAASLLWRKKTLCFNEAYFVKAIADIYYPEYPDSAIHYNRLAAKLAPYWSYPIFDIGKIHNDLGRRDSALFYFNKVVQLNPRDPQAWISLGIASQLKRPNLAITYFKKAIAIDSLQPNAFIGLGKAYNSIGAKDSAYQCLLKNVKLNPSSDSYYNLGVSMEHLLEKNSGIGLREYEKVLLMAIEYDSTNVLAHDKLIRLYLKYKVQFPQADQLIYSSIKMGLSTHPRNYNLNSLMGDYYKQHNMTDSALHYLARGFYKDVKSNIKYFNKNGTPKEKIEFFKGQVLWGGARKVRHLTKATQLNPKNFTYQYELGVSLYDNGPLKPRYYYRKALNAFSAASKLEPSEAKVLNRIGNCYWKLKLYDSAAAFYQKAIELDRKNGAYLFNYGDWLVQIKNYPEAIKYLKAAIAVESDFARSHARLADSYWNLGKYDSAKMYYLSASELKPDSESYFLSAGDAYRRLKNYDSAVLMHKRALYLSTNNFFTLERIGYDYLNQGKYEASRYFFELMNKANSKDPIYEYDMGCLFAAQGDLTQALSYLEKAVKKGYRNHAHMASDKDLIVLRGNEKFENLLNQIK